MVWPCETRTSTCRNFATISSGLYRFLAITVLLDAKTYLKSDHFNGGGSSVTFTTPHDTFTFPITDFVVPPPVAEHVFDQVTPSVSDEALGALTDLPMNDDQLVFNTIARPEPCECIAPGLEDNNLLRPGTRSSAFRDATGRGQLYTIRPITQPGETSPQSVVSSLARVERQVRRCAPH